MNGTSISHTRAMLLMPPRMTSPAINAMTAPLTMGDTLYVSFVSVAMALACTVLPIPKAATAVNTANSTAIFFHPSPRSRAYIGPPYTFPFSFFTRYFTASSPSAYFVEMPNSPVSQHHSTAPGPPSATAVATPMMLPVPMVAASAVANAPNCDTSPCDSLSR